MNIPFLRLAPALALGLPLLALAQPARPDPADPRASAPPLHYQSAFADYKPWQHTKPGDWRAVNDNVRDAGAKGGGHAGHAMPGAPAGASAPAAKASSAAHGSHHQHGGHR